MLAVLSTVLSLTRYDEWLYHSYEWATILGVVGGFFGLIILIWQTSLTRTAAQAAKASADAVRNAQRAWLFVRPDPQGVGSYEWLYKNFGQTPAKILFRSITDTVVSDITELPETPAYADDTTSVHFHIVPPGEERGFKQDYRNLFDGKPSDIIDAIRKEQKILVVYGVVRYHDVFDDSSVHETRFCYIWTPQRAAYLPGGPNSYIKTT